MLYQYKKFRTREMVSQMIKKESSELVRIVILLVILNLVVLSFYYSEKRKYDDRKVTENSIYEEKRVTEDKVSQEKIDEKNKIVGLLNDADLVMLCRHIDYSGDTIKIECSPDKFDEIYKKIEDKRYLKQNEAEGDSSNIVLKLVLK